MALDTFAAYSARLTALLGTRVVWRSLLFANVALLLYFFILPSNAVVQSKEAIKAYVSNYRESHTTFVEDAPEPVDWSQFAYCQYVTTLDYLCNSVMIFDSLVRHGAKADRLMMYPQEWTVSNDTQEGRLLMSARDNYGVSLVPITVERLGGDPTWSESFTKLLAFNQTQYKRVLSLDSDATVLQSMDELFLLPSAPVAMPRAYWLRDTPHVLSSQLVLVEPSHTEFSRIQEAFSSHSDTEYDMEIVNTLYGANCIVIPHRKYDLLTGEFGNTDHSRYLGSEKEEWDPQEVLREAKFVHFSDWPLPKPWLGVSEMQIKAKQPNCREMVEGDVVRKRNETYTGEGTNTEDETHAEAGTHAEDATHTEDGTHTDEGTQVEEEEKPKMWDCSDREAWLSIYGDFRARRKRVCGVDFSVEVYQY